MIKNGVNDKTRLRANSSQDGSTEDLILNEEESFPIDGVLRNEPYLNYVVEMPHSNEKKRNQFRRRLLTCCVIFLGFTTCIFLVLYLHEKSLNRSFQQILPTPKVKIIEKTIIEKKYCTSSTCVQAAGFMLGAIDNSVNPCEDFYLYSCGSWLKKNPIPEKKTMWSIDSFLDKQNKQVMREILDNSKMTEKDLKSKAEWEAFKYYRSCMNKKKIDQLGRKPVHKIIHHFHGFFPKDDKGRNNKTMADIEQMVYDAYEEYVTGTFFSTFVETDAKNSKKNILALSQYGLGLSYFRYKNKNASDPVLSAYLSYLKTLGALLHKPGKSDNFSYIAEEILEFEMELAKIYVPRENLTSIDQYYNRISIADLQKLVPSLSWLKFYQSIFKSANIKITADEPIVVYTLDYFKKLDKVLRKTEPRIIHNFILAKLVLKYVNHLNEDFQLAMKNLSIAQYGVYELPPRWQECVAATDNAVGFALGSLFVKAAFNGSSKLEADTMVQNIRASFKSKLKNLTWMDESTRNAAKEKADVIQQLIGYPPYILDPVKLDKKYGELVFSETQYFNNVLILEKYTLEASLAKLRKPVEDVEWQMTPPTINAYYLPSKNQIGKEICF